MPQVDVEEAKSNLPELIDAALSGEDVVIAREDRGAVKLVPLPHAQARPRFGSAEGLISVSDDFDEPLEDFDGYAK